MEELQKLLSDLKDNTGDFACSGYLPELCLPGLVVENIGHISLPVQDEQAKKIIEVAKKAPFGLGSKTLVDETVRKTWQLDPSQITIKNEHFLAGVENVVASVKNHLGCDKKTVQANLYKVLLYEKGGHFKAHRDTEKEKGMFATMVIQLPSKFEGGKITVRHAGNEKVIEMDGERSAYCCKYAAHYSDCEHEVSEIGGGYRLALVYSLCWTARGTPPSADTGPAKIRKLAKILQTICTGKRNLFSWFLAHKYSKSGLSRSGIHALKGVDASVARALQQANESLPEDQQYEFYIAEINRELQQFGEFWSDDDSGPWAGEFQANGDEEEEIDIENWFGFDGIRASSNVVEGVNLDIENDVVNFQQSKNMSAKDAVEALWGQAVGEDNTGPTGNEGATRMYWYKSYAIFAWPKDNEVNQRCKLNGYLAAVRWASSQLKNVQDKGPSTPEYKSALSDLKMVINYAVSNNVELFDGVVVTMLRTLASLRSEAVVLVNRFIADVMGKTPQSETHNSYCLGSGCGIPAFVDLTIQFGWPSLSESLKKLFDLSPVSQHGNWANFLQSLFQKKLKTVLQQDACFMSLVVCLVEKVEADAENNQLESLDTKNRVESIASLLFLISDVDILAKFTNAIQVYCQQSPESFLLQNLIRSLERDKLCDNQFWNQLLNIRIAQLVDVEKFGVRPFTWNQDDVVIHDHPAVQAFLRGPNKSMKYYGFTSIVQARKFVSTHFGSVWNCWLADRSPCQYTATATAAGAGRNAHVLIEKTTEWYDRKVIPIKQQLDELKKLRSMVQPGSSLASSPEPEQMEPPAKKRALAVPGTR